MSRHRTGHAASSARRPFAVITGGRRVEETDAIKALADRRQAAFSILSALYSGLIQVNLARDYDLLVTDNIVAMSVKPSANSAGDRQGWRYMSLTFSPDRNQWTFAYDGFRATGNDLGALAKQAMAGIEGIEGRRLVLAGKVIPRRRARHL